jgi:hypothetical protein
VGPTAPDTGGGGDKGGGGEGLFLGGGGDLITLAGGGGLVASFNGGGDEAFFLGGGGLRAADANPREASSNNKFTATSRADLPAIFTAAQTH